MLLGSKVEMRLWTAFQMLVTVGKIFVIVGLLPLALAFAPQGAPSSEPLPSYGDYSPSSMDSPNSMELAEKLALFAVMNAMAEGGDWSATHPDPCGQDVWHGLECDLGPSQSDKKLHVRSLAFGLTSGLDPNPSCRHDAYIPEAIVNLTFLQSIFVYECFTKTKTSVPSFLGQLTSLEMVDIRSNSKLTGSIPPELGNLTNLQVLSLAVNRLTGQIPDLGRLHSLQNLDLSYNALNGTLPSSLGRLVNLEIFNVRGNHIEGSIPASLGRLDKLQKLDLGENYLAGSIPSSLGRILPLVLLGLDSNRLEHGLPESFSSLMSLQYLLAHNNPMHHPLPTFWSDLRNSLVYASLSNSSYTGPIPESICELRNLTFLALDNNELTGQIPEAMEEMTSLTFLNLSGNKLSGPVPFSTKFLNALGPGLKVDGNLALCEPSTFSPGGGQRLGLPVCPEESWDYDYSSLTPRRQPAPASPVVPSSSVPSPDVPSSDVPPSADVPSSEDVPSSADVPPSSNVPSLNVPSAPAPGGRLVHHKSVARRGSTVNIIQITTCLPLFTLFAFGYAQ